MYVFWGCWFLVLIDWVSVGNVHCMSSRVHRVDFADGGLRKATRTPEGYLLVDTYLARPGVYEYRNPDGTITRELILEDELHRADSLATLGGKPVTLEHPPEDVNAENWSKHSVGEIPPDIVVTEDGRIKVQYFIKRKDAIDAVEGGVREASPGYSCIIDPTPGQHPKYGRYDAVQKDRKYNHGAITRAARGGPEIHMRADSAWQVHEDANTDPPEKRSARRRIQTLVDNGTLAPVRERKCADCGAQASEYDHVDGYKDQKAFEKIEPVCASCHHKRTNNRKDEEDMADKEQSRLEALMEENAKLKADMAEYKKKSEDTEKELAEFKKKSEDADKENTDLKEKTSLDSLNAWRVERNKLETLAKGSRIDGFDKMDNVTLRKAVAIAVLPSARKDASDEYYSAVVDTMLTDKVRGRADSNPVDDRPVFRVDSQKRDDANAMPDVEAAASERIASFSNPAKR